MREEKIIIFPFEFVSCLEFNAFKALNNHSMIKMRGIVKKENADRYMKMAEEEIWIKIFLQSEEVRYIFFQGIIVELSIKVENNLYTMEFEAKSGSFLLDVDRHIRSFQSGEMEYRQIVNICLESFPDSICNWIENENERINSLVMQYEETDWDFIKRLCSKLKVMIYPNNHIGGINFVIGLRKERMKELESDSYVLKTDSFGYTYIITDRELFEIGEFVLFKGKELCVCKSISKMMGGELYHQYYLRDIRQFDIYPIENSKLRGISLEADVIAVEGDKVKVRILKDENDTNSGSRWYPYATVYSTPDGTGWYCMPEIGDRVRITFPNTREQDAYIISAVHIENIQQRNIPDNKSFMNKQRKEIVFTPDSIILRNNKGMELVMKDREGIRIVSDKDIIIQAKDAVRISSNNANITLKADNEMSMQQGNVKLLLNEGIKMAGGKINMN
ncbi:MAG: phage baseplate assembly protein V [Eubacterium sp.]|nr:phage baseplate assembly protein V [Eubacterium sp.]